MFRGEKEIPFVNKPWGYERVFAHTDTYVGKYMFIEEGHQLSRQYHEHKDETIFVLAGQLIIEIGPDEDSTITKVGVEVGEAYHITPGTIHRFCASEGVAVELIEVSTPELQDVVRLEDDYNRIPDAIA